MSVARLAAVLVALGLVLTACGPSAEDLEAVDYAPVTQDEWPVSTPEAQGLDPDLVAELYYDAARLETAYSLLVFKNGYLVAEDYFGIGRPDLQVNVHSVTKSINSALVGLALEEGCLTSLDQKLMEFFPEFENRITDNRKNDITIRQMLQMRAGFPWEESSAEGTEWLFTGFHESDLVGVPLAYDPGTDSTYSNFTAHLLGIIVSRACGTDLKTFAQEHLFDPLGITPGFWQTDWDGNYLGFSDIDLSSTDLAAFGLMYLDDGSYEGVQVVPSEWVEESLDIYSEGTWTVRVGSNWGDNAYGYQWWSIQAGNHRYNLAWGHGGQQIALIEPLDMMIVFLADPLHLQHGDGPWKIEKANLNLVADFVASLP
ncbi:serine hydrolase [Microbacter sp. GSS18]|nr:serine hydrolase [Microbacter sp. GSS18]